MIGRQVKKKNSRLKKHSVVMTGLRGIVFVAAIILVAPVAMADDALQITNVSADRTLFEPQKGEPITISFRITAPARVTLNIYDARDYLIARIDSAGLLQPGDHSLAWNGHDLRGRPVPPEAYVYTLSATTGGGQTVVHDLTDQTGGETVYVDDIEYNPETGKLAYSLSYPARIFIRMGIEEGSVLRTLVNGAVRKQGRWEETWDGWDESHVINLKNHPKRQFFGEGMRLSRNTILIESTGAPQSVPQWIAPPEPDAVRPAGKKPSGLNPHAYHPREHCRDVKLDLNLPGDLPKTKDGIPVVSGATPFRVDMSPEDALVVESQRFEVVFFLNNQMLYENEVSYTPYTWNWDPKALTGGTHYMTAFVVAFGGHYGVDTVKFAVASEKAAKE